MTGKTKPVSRPADLTVVVCTYNGVARGLDRCLAALAGSEVEPRIELLVVDDGSTDATASVAKRYGARYVRHERNLGIGAARATGIAQASGDLVAFVDDDCIPAPGWAAALVTGFRDIAVVGVGGTVTGRTCETPVQRFLQACRYACPAPATFDRNAGPVKRLLTYLRESYRPTHIEDGDTVTDVYTSNCAYRRGHVLRVGNFDPDLRSSEDTDMAGRLQAAFGVDCLRMAKRAVVFHDHEGKLIDLMKLSYRRAADVVSLAEKNDVVVPLSPVFLAMAGLLLTGFVSSQAVLVLAAPPLAYNWWFFRSEQRMSLDAVLFPYIEAVADGATALGLLRGYLRRDRI